MRVTVLAGESWVGFFFFVPVVSYRDVCCACLKSGEVEFSRNPEHPLSLHMLKGVGPLVMGSMGGQEFPGPPSSPKWFPIASRIPCMRVGQSVPCPSGSATACSCLSVSVCVRC